MANDIYPIEFSLCSGRAYVKINGEINATKISNTFIALTMNKIWINGDRSVLWDARNARFPELFEFSDILKETQITKYFARPGKSAVVVETSSEMQIRLAHFYKGIAAMSTGRQIELFYSQKEAEAWLDS